MSCLEKMQGMLVIKYFLELCLLSTSPVKSCHGQLRVAYLVILRACRSIVHGTVLAVLKPGEALSWAATSGSYKMGSKEWQLRVAAKSGSEEWQQRVALITHGPPLSLCLVFLQGVSFLHTSNRRYACTKVSQETRDKRLKRVATIDMHKCGSLLRAVPFKPQKLTSDKPARQSGT